MGASSAMGIYHWLPLRANGNTYSVVCAPCHENIHKSVGKWELGVGQVKAGEKRKGSLISESWIVLVGCTYGGIVVAYQIHVPVCAVLQSYCRFGLGRDFHPM